MFEDLMPPITVATDVVLFAVARRVLSVLLVERKHPPFAGTWALPGGLVEPDEPLVAAARRELREETGVDEVPYLSQLAVFGHPERDPRGRVISVVYLGLINALVPVRGADDAREARWWPVGELPPLAFDHMDIISCALNRLQYLVRHDLRLIFHLVKEPFTLSEVQFAYEAVMGEPTDRRNFRRRLLQSTWVEEIGIRAHKGPGRPARHYRCKPEAVVPSPEDRCV